MFIVFILSFKTFISSVYSVTAIAMPEFATSVTGSVDFLCEGAQNQTNSLCVCTHLTNQADSDSNGTISFGQIFFMSNSFMLLSFKSKVQVDV